MSDMQGKGCKTNATNAAGSNATSMGKTNAGGSNTASIGKNDNSSMGEARSKTSTAGGSNTASMGKTNNSPMGDNKSSAEIRAKNNGCNVQPSGGGCGTGCKPGK